MRKGVNPLTTEEECVLKQSSRRVSPLPVGEVGRTTEEQSDQRDDQEVVRASDGERDSVKSFTSEAWTGEVFTRTSRQQ